MCLRLSFPKKKDLRKSQELEAQIMVNTVSNCHQIIVSQAICPPIAAGLDLLDLPQCRNMRIVQAQVTQGVSKIFRVNGFNSNATFIILSMSRCAFSQFKPLSLVLISRLIIQNGRPVLALNVLLHRCHRDFNIQL